ncbi:aldo/keto reductase [Mucisphaera sp.]|uniref:aldo/keto reductase n=1 Tax=Mucisphaera sp. TaxID=2913024 RepID=UPI003D0BDA12
MKHINWGIIGAGNIAHPFIRGIAEVADASVVAITRRSTEKAQAFASEYGIDTFYTDADELIADPNVHVIYIATPHPAHATWAIRAMQAGKHVLCEKPAGMNIWQVQAMVRAARQHNVFFMEAFKDRVHPLFKKLFDTITDGTIGKVRLIDAAFGFGGDHDPTSRILDPALGGGAILDVGCYPVAFARKIAGLANGQTFADPLEVKASGYPDTTTGVDRGASAILRFEGNVLATVSTSIDVKQIWIRVHGEDGWIEIPGMSWHPAFESGTCSFLIHANDQTQTIEVKADKPMFAYEIEVACQAIRAGQSEAPAPAMTWADSIGQANTLDRWLKQVGISYPSSTPEGFPLPLNAEKLTKPTQPAMTYGDIPHLDRPVSRLIMGCDNQQDFAHAAVMFDAFFQAGGNTFDTAWIYGGGRQEKLLGHWLRSRGVRDDCVIISKGGITPDCHPEAIRKQFNESLDRLGLDQVDVYILHRDNPDLPVGELVDVLDELRQEGRVKTFGGSNWSIQRFQAAQEYAAANNRQQMSVLSNNLSLARMLKPVWEGCVSASDPESRAYLEKTQTALLAWSSQARGYFARADEKTDLGIDTTDDCFDNTENQQRRERALKLARHHGVTAVNIAAAYVLSQPFPSFALVGPRNLTELDTTLPALNINLTPEERAWLDLATDTSPL